MWYNIQADLIQLIEYRGIAQQVEQRSPKPRAEGSIPSAPAKNPKALLSDFSFVPQAQHHLRATHATSFDRQVNIIAACGINERC